MLALCTKELCIRWKLRKLIKGCKKSKLGMKKCAQLYRKEKLEEKKHNLGQFLYFTAYTITYWLLLCVNLPELAVAVAADFPLRVQRLAVPTYGVAALLAHVAVLSTDGVAVAPRHLHYCNKHQDIIA